jgi:hypothetical protein
MDQCPKQIGLMALSHLNNYRQPEVEALPLSDQLFLMASEQILRELLEHCLCQACWPTSAGIESSRVR